MSESERQPLLAPPGLGPLQAPSPNAVGETTVPPSSSTFGFWSIFITLALGAFLAALDHTIVTASWASIGSDLKQLQHSSWIATGYMLTMVTFQPLYGKLCDIFGQKACLLFVYFVFGMGCLACGLARNMEALVAARILSGIGGAGLETVAAIVLSDIIPLRQRGTWQGLIDIFWSIGGSSGAPIGGFFSDTIGWRWAFFIQVPVAAIAFLAIVFLFHQKSSQQTGQSESGTLWGKFHRVDFLGATTLLIAVSTFLLGMDNGSNVSWSSPITYISLLLALTLSLAFVFVEATPALAKEPFAPKDIMTRALLPCYFANFFLAGTIFCVIFQVPLYVQVVLRKSASTSGAILIPAVLSAVMGSLLAGVIMQYTRQYKKLAVISMSFMVLGCLFISLIAGISVSMSFCLYGMAVAMFFIRLGEGMLCTVTLISTIAIVTPEDQAKAISLNYFSRSVGALLGISISSAAVQYSLKWFLGTALAGREVDIGHASDISS
ncbi:hypothetical protein M422DRAFT_243850 [Sphaerobolus stellatus SS14]|nr:hypothetical protein M422DRAFT_243850 [Sphaerobolus stellatus SS14]